MTWLSSFRLKLFKVFPCPITKMPNTSFLILPPPNCPWTPEVPALEPQAKGSGLVKLISSQQASFPSREAPISACHTVLPLNPGSAQSVTSVSPLQSCSHTPTSLWLTWRRENDPHPHSAMVAVTLGAQARKSTSVCSQHMPSRLSGSEGAPLVAAHCIRANPLPFPNPGPFDWYWFQVWTSDVPHGEFLLVDLGTVPCTFLRSSRSAREGLKLVKPQREGTGDRLSTTFPPACALADPSRSRCFKAPRAVGLLTATEPQKCSSPFFPWGGAGLFGSY